jgi:hypothetical protein
MCCTSGALPTARFANEREGTSRLCATRQAGLRIADYESKITPSPRLPVSPAPRSPLSIRRQQRQNPIRTLTPVASRGKAGFFYTSASLRADKFFALYVGDNAHVC